MFERFTERARHVVVLAQEEARAGKHHEIGCDHILLGLIREEEGLASRVLVALGVTEEATRKALLERREPGETKGTGQVPFAPAAKDALECALREALSLGHNYIGTEHVLLALVRKGNAASANILGSLGAGDVNVIRDEILKLLSGTRGPRAVRQPDITLGLSDDEATFLRELLGARPHSEILSAGIYDRLRRALAHTGSLAA